MARSSTLEAAKPLSAEPEAPPTWVSLTMDSVRVYAQWKEAPHDGSDLEGLRQPEAQSELSVEQVIRPKDGPVRRSEDGRERWERPRG